MLREHKTSFISGVSNPFVDTGQIEQKSRAEGMGQRNTSLKTNIFYKGYRIKQRDSPSAV
jgi:hypothetical protein